LNASLCRFALAVALILPAAASATEPRFPPGSRIGMTPLAETEVSKRFTGFEDQSKGLAFTFIEMPREAYPELTIGLTAERLKEQGVTLKKREDLKLGGERNAVLVAGEQSLGQVAVRKWLLVVEDPTMTAFVIAQSLPGAERRSDAEIKAALATVAIRPPLAIEDQIAALPFRVTERAGFRPVRVMAGNSLFLTDGPKDTVAKAEQPIVIVAQSTSPAPPPGPQRDSFARSALYSNSIFKDMVLERAQSFRQRGADWHEIVARGADAASGEPVVLTQTIRFAPDHYVRMLGVVKVAERDAAMPRFRAVFDGVEVE
jgi:hypothetical protein